MLSRQKIIDLASNLAGLGMRRLALLAIVGLAVMASVGLAAAYLGRPAMQPIYTGLTPQDVTRITTALAEAGILFDVNEPRNAVLVPFGQTARARTLLAQKGLPTSARAGYELFDQMGSIGLTSFMQEITRVRALEGEIARTIQSLDGVAAARVHLVLPEPVTFRRERRDPSASVLLKIDDKWHGASGQVVRHVVAAAVPGMKIEHVSVASTDGRMLATSGDEQSLSSGKLADMEKSMAAELEHRAGRTLSSVLGSGNFQISITVRLDVDRQQTNETVFDPKSRVERSVRTVKQSGTSEEGGNKPTVGVEANVPREETNQTEGDKRRQREDRREELVNYELNSKTVQTVREGYRVQRLAIAAVISRKHIADQIGPNASPAVLDARIAEFKRLIAAATGASIDRDDRIEITVADLGVNTPTLSPTAGPGVLDQLVLNTGTAINALAMLGIVFMIVWFGLRPAARMLSGEQALTAHNVAGTALGADAGRGLPAPDDPPPAATAADGAAVPQRRRLPTTNTRDRLAAIVDADDAVVTRVLKGWMQEAK